jgi:hypothetical protein
MSTEFWRAHVAQPPTQLFWSDRGLDDNALLVIMNFLYPQTSPRPPLLQQLFHLDLQHNDIGKYEKDECYFTCIYRCRVPVLPL